MYMLNLLQPTLTDKQKEELFSKESFDEMMEKLNEKKEIEEMKNLEEVLADKLEVVYEKALKLNEKAEIYNLASKGETLENLIDGIENIEGQLDDSLGSFSRIEDSISKAWERMKPEAMKAWESISEYYSDDESEEENDDEIKRHPLDHIKETHDFEELGKALISGNFTVSSFSTDSSYGSKPQYEFQLCIGNKTVRFEIE